jgi:GTP-binding protein EngB required for normal cell division
LLILAVLVAAALLAFGLILGLLNSLLEFQERLARLPALVRYPLFALCAAALCGMAVMAWKLFRGKPQRTAPGASHAVPDRQTIEARVAELRLHDSGAASLEQELVELDLRRHSGECHVAMFGEISTGKSSLVRALGSEADTDVDVIGGTTRWVRHFRGSLADGRELVIADMPGSGEVDGLQREQLARDEALRAHVVVYVVSADLTRAQHNELRWLCEFGKPVILVLNKVDRYEGDQRNELMRALGERYGKHTRAIVSTSSGGIERFERRLADGRIEQVERERVPEVDSLLDELERVTSVGVAALEPAREAAVLASVDQRSHALARLVAARESEATVFRYTRRAVIGALAAVAPGTDILIQGALATAMVRELARIHGVPVRELDVESLLTRLGLSVRNTTAIVLAIAGNALKAFPGLGTLGGGALHAIAYGLAFDSVGRAVAMTLAEHARLDHDTAEQSIRDLLAQPSRDRIERVAKLVVHSLRGDAESSRD